MTLQRLNSAVTAPPPPSPSLAPVGNRALADLLAALDEAGIRHCHWKSNVRLPQALDGKTDLDLLVDALQAQAFRAILGQRGVKALLAAPGKAYPGVENYLGFDQGSGKLFHLHVHFRLILGEQLVKDTVLPLQELFLASATVAEHAADGVRVPAPELELIVFCVRALLKYRDRDALKDLLKVRQPGLSEVIVQELRWLKARTTPQRLREALQAVEAQVAGFDGAIVLSFLEVMHKERRDGAALFRLRSRLRAVLRPYRRQSQARASLTYFRELWFRRKRRMRRDVRGQPRGLSLALVGADGAGKTTMGAMLRNWLGWKLDVHAYYLGSKQPSQRSRLIYLLFRMLRRSQRSASRRLGEASAAARLLAQARQTALYGHQVSLALDRLRRHRVGQRLAQEGAIVLYDRFPLSPRLDGPKIREMIGSGGSAVERWLCRVEEDIYERFEWPEAILLLDVTPELSLQRKPDHKRDAIEAKYRQLQELVAGGAEGRSKIMRIDAAQEMEAVITALKQAVWELL